MPSSETFIENLRKAAAAMDDVLEERADVKSGEVTKEEIINSKGYQLFTAILNTSENIFTRDDIQELIVRIGESIGEEASQSLTQLLVLLTSTSSFDTISYYDERLKQEINENFQPLIGNVNCNHADILAQEEALKLFRKELETVSDRLAILERRIESMEHELKRVELEK